MGAVLGITWFPGDRYGSFVDCQALDKRMPYDLGRSGKILFSPIV